MSKLNLSGVLGKRRKIRWITFGSAILLIFFAVQLIVLDNPKKPRADGLTQTSNACYLTNSDYNLGTSTICDGKILTITNGTLTVAGKHNFRSIDMYNNAHITHEALTSGDIESDRHTLKSSGQLKMVYLTVSGSETGDGNITLNTGSSINVDFKGYPGGEAIAAWAKDGYGLGASAGTSTDAGTGPPSTGAGYGGNGGGSSGIYGQKYPTSYDYLNFSESQFYFGSGSGGSYINYVAGRFVDGASGGGRIYIHAQGTIQIKDAASFISSRGADGTTSHDPGYCSAGSGGGSGGTIWIEASDFQSTGTLYSVAGGTGTTGNDGGVGYEFVEPSWVVHNTNAIGGTGLFGCDGSPQYGGGGGRLVMKKVASTGGLSIKKKLFAAERNGLPDVDFNPYALQSNDVIEVKIIVSNIDGIFTLTDEPLAAPYSGGKKCSLVTGSISDGGSLNPDGNIQWNYGLGAAPEKEFSYQCKIL